MKTADEEFYLEGIEGFVCGRVDGKHHSCLTMAKVAMSNVKFRRKNNKYLAGAVWAQKNQRGVDASSTVKLQEANTVAPGWVSWKPESIPCLGVVMIWQGLANVDCVTD
jgi:hypothetical protein